MDLKFRAWDYVDKVMLSWLCITQEAFNRGEFTLMYTLLANRFHRYKIMPFTGYFDRDNKEIYEGDVIDFCKSSPEKRYAPSVIKFMHGAFCAIKTPRIDSTKFDFELDFGMPGNCVGSGNPWIIIGNIYENPEVLNSKSLC